MTDRYEITVDYLDSGEVMVQAAGVPHPVGLFKETGWDLTRLLADAQDAIAEYREREYRERASGQPTDDHPDAP